MKRMNPGLWLAAGLTGALTGVSAPPASAQIQHMAVPSYFYPGPIWTTLDAAAPTVGLAIINPNSGPGTSANPDYVKQVKESKAHGVKVIAYIHTSYGKRPFAEVKSEVQKYAAWYHVDGIFFDESASGADMLPYYKKCHDAVHALIPAATIVLNPGTTCAEGYMNVSDIICTWETEEPDYLNKFQAPAWTAKYPAGRIWHIVLNVPESDLPKVLALTKSRHAGWVYVTSLTEKSNANPYGKLPDSSYWATEIKTLASK